MKRPAIKALCFDVFGTATDWYGSVTREGESISRRTGVAVDWSEFVIKWRVDGYYASLIEIASGKSDYIPTDEIHRRKLLDLLQEYGLTCLSPEETEVFNQAWHRIDAWPDAAQGLRMMKADYMIMPLSNGEYRTLLDISKHNDLPWDGIISADFFRSVKPDPRVYQGAADLLELPPSQIMMVACHPRDLEAAAAVGFRTAYVARPAEYGPHQFAEEQSLTFDAQASDFVELAQILRLKDQPSP